jgi:hypothetical protein
MKNGSRKLSAMYPVYSVRHVSGCTLKQFAALPTSPSPAPRVKPVGLRLTWRRGPSLSPLKGGEGLGLGFIFRLETQRLPPRSLLRPSRPGFAVVSGLRNFAAPPRPPHREGEVRAPAR